MESKHTPAKRALSSLEEFYRPGSDDLEFQELVNTIHSALESHDALVEALEGMLAMIYEGLPESEWDEIKQNAKAALALARGEK